MLRAASSVFGRVPGFPKHDTAFPTAIQCCLSRYDLNRNAAELLSGSDNRLEYNMFLGDAVFSLFAFLSIKASSNKPPLLV